MATQKPQLLMPNPIVLIKKDNMSLAKQQQKTD